MVHKFCNCTETKKSTAYLADTKILWTLTEWIIWLEISQNIQEVASAFYAAMYEPDMTVATLM